MKVNVLGKYYQITETGENASGGTIMGACNRQKQAITILTEGIGQEQKEETILHEVVHIIDGELKLGLEEEDVSRLSVGLYSAGCRVKVEK